MPTLYIDEFVGISNRLEVLPLAFAIQKAYGHEIVMDWHELDNFSVEGARRGIVRFRARYKAQRMRECSQSDFDALEDKKIILRSLDGPDHLLRPIYLETAKRIKIIPKVRQAIEDTFSPYKDRPVVAVHMRRGDFRVGNNDFYDTTAEFPAVPDWWYAHAMQCILKKNPDTAFFLAGNEDPTLNIQGFENLPVFTLKLNSHYSYKKNDHRSVANPVGDMFALACCKTLIATPISGYSHFAANALEPPSTAIVPIPLCKREAPKMGIMNIYGQRLPDWRKGGRTGEQVREISDEMQDLNLNQNADLSWLEAQTS